MNLATMQADLLTALHEGMFEQPLWQSFLDRLRALTGATRVALTFRPSDQEDAIELESGGTSPPHVQRHIRDNFARHPQRYRTMREGRVYSLEELLDSDDPAQRALRDNVLHPTGVCSTRTVRIAEPSGVDAWLTCISRGPLGPDVAALMAALAPHLRIAMRTFIAFERERFRSALASDAIRRLNFGWLTLDAHCRILEVSPLVEHLFQRSNVLRRGRYDRLTPASPIVDREIASLIRDFAKDREMRPRAISLGRDPWIDILFVPVQKRALAGGTPPVVIAYLSGDRLSQADRCEQLVDLFGLLPSEARFAWAIAHGLSIAEAAGSLGLTLETARNYSKRIYAKTGARGQAELVRNILTSVLALA